MTRSISRSWRTVHARVNDAVAEPWKAQPVVCALLRKDNMSRAEFRRMATLPAGFARTHLCPKCLAIVSAEVKTV